MDHGTVLLKGLKAIVNTILFLLEKWEMSLVPGNRVWSIALLNYTWLRITLASEGLGLILDIIIYSIDAHSWG